MYQLESEEMSTLTDMNAKIEIGLSLFESFSALDEMIKKYQKRHFKFVQLSTRDSREVTTKVKAKDSVGTNCKLLS